MSKAQKDTRMESYLEKTIGKIKRSERIGLEPEYIQ
jgi:hypothetical protein